MRSTHNTIRALAIGVGLTLLVVSGTAAMMAAFSGPTPATDIYRRVASTPSFEPATHQATAHDTVLYEPVVLANGRIQWVLTEAPNTATRDSGETRAVSYSLVPKPPGLSKAIKSCNRSANHAYDIACNRVI